MNGKIERGPEFYGSKERLENYQYQLNAIQETGKIDEHPKNPDSFHHKWHSCRHWESRSIAKYRDEVKQECEVE